jgi:hypothetical protein
MSNPDPTLDIVRYAEILAHVRHFPPDKQAEVVARLGVRRRDWDAASAKWQRVRDAERVSGNLEATVCFGRALADARASLAARRPPIESLGPMPGPDGDLEPNTTPAAAGIEADQGPSVPAGAPGVDPPQVQVPSFLSPSQRTSEALPAFAPAPAPLAFTLPLGTTRPQVGAMPFLAPGAVGEALDRAIAHADAVQGPKAARPALGTGTVGIGPDSPAPAPPPGVPTLTVQQYASLRAELHQCQRSPRSAGI